jgi:hypothetical protein
MRLKGFSVVAVMTFLLALASSAFAQKATAPTFSNASLSGTYTLQMQGVNDVYGYFTDCTSSNNCSGWVNLGNTNSACPAGQNCSTSSAIKYVYGTIAFDGAGHVTSVKVYSFNLNQDPVSQGPMSATGKYSVATTGQGTITLTQTGGGGSLVLGIGLAGLDATTGIAMTATLHTVATSTSTPGDIQTGVAFHQ